MSTSLASRSLKPRIPFLDQRRSTPECPESRSLTGLYAS